MKASFDDDMYHKYQEDDFADAKPVDETPVLAKLQSSGKSRITLLIDNDILAFFKVRAIQQQGNYQTLINDALKQFTQDEKN